MPHAAVLTRTPATPRLWSRDLKALCDNLIEGGIAIVPTAIAERGAYRSMFSVGATLATLDPSDASSLESARKNAQAFAGDVIEMAKGKAQ